MNKTKTVLYFYEKFSTQWILSNNIIKTDILLRTLQTNGYNVAELNRELTNEGRLSLVLLRYEFHKITSYLKKSSCNTKLYSINNMTNMKTNLRAK